MDQVQLGLGLGLGMQWRRGIFMEQVSQAGIQSVQRRTPITLHCRPHAL